MSTITVGDKIPLALNLHDNRPGMSIRAEVYSMLGERLATVYLYESESGLYVNYDLPMPDLPCIIAKYDVEDSEDYESVAERFDSVKRDPEPDKYITGQVDSIVKSNEFITGVIDEIKNN